MVKRTRTYRSTIRRGEAADAIVTAAGKLFANKGYAATSIVDIATEAEVARPTVFAAVGAKPVIFASVLESATCGDYFAAAAAADAAAADADLATGTAPDAGVARALIERAIAIACEDGATFFDLHRAAQCAAEADEALRELLETADASRRAFGMAVGAELANHQLLRDPYDATRAGVLFNTLMGPATWWTLVREEGWTIAQFQEWAADTLTRQLLA